MKQKTGDKAPFIQLPSIDGTMFDSRSLDGKPYMVSFFRFASCPFCNMRIHELVKRYDELGDNFNIIAIFDSPLTNLIEHTEGHKALFSIIADAENIYYKSYNIERSAVGVFRGMIFRMPTLLKGLFKGYLPLVFKGNLFTMPADFLIDKNGVIQNAYYGKDEGDHLAFEEVKQFAQHQTK